MRQESSSYVTVIPAALPPSAGLLESLQFLNMFYVSYRRIRDMTEASYRRFTFITLYTLIPQQDTVVMFNKPVINTVWSNRKQKHT